MQDDRTPVLEYARPSRAVMSRRRDRGTMHFSLGVATGLMLILSVACLTGQVRPPDPFLAGVLLLVLVFITAYFFIWGKSVRVQLERRALIERSRWISISTGSAGSFIMIGAGLLSRLDGGTPPMVLVGCIGFACVPLLSPWLIYKRFAVMDSEDRG